MKRPPPRSTRTYTLFHYTTPFRSEVELILHRQVDRIHGLRRHPPFGAVHRLADLGELVRIFDLPARDLVRIGAVGGDGVAAIIAPAFRVTDADDDGFDLFEDRKSTRLNSSH